MSTSDPESQIEGVKKDRKLWFEDGNIIIVAGNNAFRLYKGMLASVSPVFKDMFFCAHPEDREIIDGCPTVHLPDSPMDLCHFFSVATFTLVESLGPNYLMPFDQLAAIIRIAHKYQAERVLKAVTSRFRKFFCQDVLEEFGPQQDLDYTWQKFWVEKEKECGIRVPMNGATGIEAVNLGHLLGCDDVLPLSFFLCCAGDPLTLRNGFQREDGTVERLSDADYLGCVRAVPELMQTIHRVDVEAIRACEKAAQKCKCKKVFVEMAEAYIKEPFVGPLTDGLVWFSERTSKPRAYLDREGVLCHTCLIYSTMFFNEIMSRHKLKLDLSGDHTGCIRIVHREVTS